MTGKRKAPATGGEPVPAEPAEDPVTGASSKSTRTTTRRKKSALWKSVLGGTGGGFGCELQTLYGETRRMPDGWRYDAGANEAILFGVGVDRILRYLYERLIAGTAGDSVTEADAAVSKAMQVCRGKDTREPWDQDAWDLLRKQLTLAADRLVGNQPNRVKVRTRQGEQYVEPAPEPDGRQGPPLFWLTLDGMELQAKLRSPDAVGGRGLSGAPDFLWRDQDGLIVGWVDAKAPGRAKSYPAAWSSSEVVAYDYMCAQENGGQLPDWHGYLEYRRTATPYWALTIQEPVPPETLDLARHYMDRWSTALDDPNPQAVGFNTQACARCEWRDPIPEVEHDGCAVGQAVAAVTAQEGEPV